ncbi:uncharacterized protein LOC132188083 [Corylus avellana]|uniref:uncharacterized protein LOC132188083 n=1 Tax=Corylus avellana TaxID=13451 RepID=UPI001E1F2D43|nr:uncharacterized protein LOC132188083 [Corylus avellana]
MAETKVSLKLLIDKKGHRVLFAEADKKFVDFIFSILTLPVGTVTRLLQKKNMAGCLGSLYKSIENLSDIYIQPDQDKMSLLKPKVAISGAKVPLLLPSVEQSCTDRKIYRCGSYNCQFVANDSRANCPSCGKPMNIEQFYVEYAPSNIINASSSSEGGYVKGVITYMVMDDLEVKPMSTISSITLLTKFNVRDLGSIEEKVVDLGIDEVLSLLEVSLKSITVLTDVFLRNDTDEE